MARTTDATSPDAGSEPEPQRRRGRRGERQAAAETGVWYPRWYWPSFSVPGIVVLAFLFVLPAYVVISVAFGTTDFERFGRAVPYYAPWWWSFDTFNQTLSQFWGPDAIYQDALIRTFAFVFSASAICLVLGYSVAYFTARKTTKYKGLVLILLISPLWISYLMRIYAWQGLLDTGGPINVLLGPFGFRETDLLSGLPITVILGLVYGYIPFMILPIYASLDRIQENLLEAGRDLGASGRQTFWRVTLPMSRPAILTGLVIVTLPMFGDYYTNDLLGSTRTQMFGNLIAVQNELSGGKTRTASLVIILSVIVLVPMLYYLRETRRASERA
ncbi:MAG TPA: ABC transporter permease [Actinomycetota bacterium]|nr:ABC transporter permease [Actinomycetota bacterium]